MTSRWLLTLLFFASGASGLIYQVTWTRMLTVVFGTTVFAASTVLFAFMGGLGVGSWCFGRLADRQSQARALRSYALLEVGIALSAAVVPLLLRVVEPVYVQLYRQCSLGTGALTTVRFAVSLLVLAVPTVLMGGTLPVLCRHAVRRHGTFGGETGWLYAVNTLGAAGGCALAGFVCVELLGIRMTMYLGVAINAIVGLAAWWLWSKWNGASLPPDEESEARVIDAEEPVSSGDRRNRLLALIAVAGSGFTGLAYEVLWTRMLVFLLGNTVHAFSIMLMTVLFGISAGAALFGRVADRVGQRLALLAILQALIGFSALASVPILCAMSEWLAHGPSAIARVHFTGLGPGLLASLAAMLVPTMLMGGTLPVVLRIRAGSADRTGRTVGDVYFVNTMAAAVGPLIAGFVLIPAIGIQRTLALVACVNVAAATMVICGAASMPRLARAIGVVLLVAVIGTGAGLSRSDALQRFFARKAEGRVLAIEEGPDTTVTVEARPSGMRFISVDGIRIAGTVDTMKLRAHLAMLLHPDPERVLVIGFGSGITFGTVAERYPAEVDCVDISPTVVRTGKHFTLWNHNVLRNPRAHMILEDARTYVACSDRKYDVIISDPPHPFGARAAALYCREFYEACAARLNDGGVFLQWVPRDMEPAREFKMMVRTFLEAFPDGTLWGGEDAHLIAARGELNMDPAVWQGRLREPAIAHDLPVAVRTAPNGLLSLFLLDSQGIRAFTGDLPIITDDRPIIEFSIPRHFHQPTARAKPVNWDELVQFARGLASQRPGTK